ncbi:hypothetical protein N825_23135 [Skermanella stibiiresistens SB22]|jgi:hypothetical protein|uniref:Uncharacterized protein n=1 Tax=Skermanella stibiiresistens SB22 TaxID=1385369 RepID=W9GSM4_9PROT|nr:hypothetical protein [Skermanella stibiiresistens]EWY36895.1 hypothetical protein N825_23135 [Skermanella stibiiresistens SB22]
MTTLTVEGELRGHVAGALRDYITKLYEFKASTPSAAAKADYDRTIAEVQLLLDKVEQ